MREKILREKLAAGSTGLTIRVECKCKVTSMGESSN